jgi:S-disulfanyl-L-cysteine oxidoreductase SoxD
MKARIGAVTIIVLAVVGMFYAALRAQERSVWDGVYTEEQAKRGKVAYDEECLVCHGEDGVGEVVDIAPALVGGAYTANYDKQPLSVMFERFRTTMPVGKENQLTMEMNADLVAFVLKINGYPAGKTELPSDLMPLQMIMFTAQK